MMDLGIKIVLGLLSVPLLALGARVMFQPSAMLGALGVKPQGQAGLNTIRGVVGGALLASAGMLGLGLALDETLWFLAVAVLMGVAAFGRIVGIVVDGFDKAITRPLVIELVLVVVPVFAHLRFGA